MSDLVQTKNEDKQRQYLVSILQDHRVLLLKLIRNIYQQSLGIFRWFFFLKGRHVLWRSLVNQLSAQTLVRFYKIGVAAASSWIRMSWEMFIQHAGEAGILIIPKLKSSFLSDSGIEMINKLIIDTTIGDMYLHQTRYSSTKDSTVTLESKKIKKAKLSTNLKSIKDQKFLNNLPKYIYS